MVRFCTALPVLGSIFFFSVANATENAQNSSIGGLSRFGYQTGRWRLGNLILTPEVNAESHYDSNVFATSRAERGDDVFNVGPRLDIASDNPRLNLTADAEFNVRRHATQTTEDTETFGAGTSGIYIAGNMTTLDGKLRYDRATESRADPEANPILLRPAKLDSLVADFGYRYQRSRLGIEVRAGVQRTAYLDPADADRDQTSTSGSVRLNWEASARVGLFVQGYVNRRDARLLVDRNGVDRDSTTLGALGGIRVDVAERWRGEVGVGCFSANPDAALPSFSGLVVRGDIAWTPTRRTIIILKATSGDVGTIRSGASGRIDSRVGIHIDEEARHNLLLHAGFTFDDTSYRGNLRRHLSQYALDGEVEMIVWRSVSVFVQAAFVDRSADNIFDRFTRTVAGVGLRLKT